MSTAETANWRSPGGLLALALALFAFSVLFSVTAVQAALFLAIIFLFLERRSEGSLRALPGELKSHPLFPPWAAYLGVCLLTALTAYYPGKALGQLNSDFLKFLCCFTLLLAVRKRHAGRLAHIYAAAALLAALYGVAEVLTVETAEGVRPNRANGFMNAVRYGEVMALAFAMAMSRLLMPPARPAFRRETLFYGLTAAAAFAAILLSQTRGAYLAALVSLGAIFVFAPAARRKLLLLTALLILGGFGAAYRDPALRGRLAAMVRPERPAAGDFTSPSAAIAIRMELWTLGLEMFRAHPLLGVGPDNVKKVFKKFHPEPIGYMETWGSLHNLYLHQAAERGLPGLGALLWLFGAFFLFALRRFRAAPGPGTLWALCALPAYFVMNLTEISFQHVHTAFAVFLALAVASASEKEI